tara:strand:- start:309 stop:512 length:204 start_codon:yes stop_codon:yes gene_type:complete
MGMSSYILDLEEQFDTKVVDAIKESEHVSEAVAVAMKHKHLVNMTDAEIEDYVQDGWNEVWSEYAFG